MLYYPPDGTPLNTLPSNYCLNSCCVNRFVEMGYINDDEVPCCSKDVKREDESLLQKFVPVHVYSESSVSKMIEQDLSSRRGSSFECNFYNFGIALGMTLCPPLSQIVASSHERRTHSRLSNRMKPLLENKFLLIRLRNCKVL